MAATIPSIPKGTRDFSPEQMAKRNHVFGVIRKHFELFGFQPLETPAMEQLAVLTGKYGEEGDRLIYKILNAGNYLEGITPADLERGAAALAPRLAERALRYDLTVPFARYVAMNRHQITLPFRRYQMQPVWRADRPQKGRYREFWQCDADVVGTQSLVCEGELLALLHQVFTALGVRVTIKLNSRKLLTAVASRLGAAERIVDFCQALDKLDKIGRDGVERELAARGFAPDAVAALGPVLELSGQGFERLEPLHVFTGPEGDAGRAELEQIRNLAVALGVPDGILEFDPTLARGLDYYTGAIIEVKAQDAAMGSISGGGRYDDLTGVFGLSGVPGVGVSFGIDRICDVMEELGLFKSIKAASTQVLVTYLSETEQPAAITLTAALRKEGIATEVYPEAAKLKKTLAYADKLGIAYVAILGPDEAAQGKVSWRDLRTGEQKLIDQALVHNYLVKAELG